MNDRSFPCFENTHKLTTVTIINCSLFVRLFDNVEVLGKFCSIIKQKQQKKYWIDPGTTLSSLNKIKLIANIMSNGWKMQKLLSRKIFNPDNFTVLWKFN